MITLPIITLTTNDAIIDHGYIGHHHIFDYGTSIIITLNSVSITLIKITVTCVTLTNEVIMELL